MEDLTRLLTLFKYINDHVDKEGFEALHDVVVNGAPFQGCEHDLEGAYSVACHTLYTLFDVQFKDQMVFGKSKLSMEGLMGNLVMFLERVENFQESPSDPWPMS